MTILGKRKRIRAPYKSLGVRRPPAKRRRMRGKFTVRRRQGKGAMIRLPRVFPRSLCVDLPYDETVIMPGSTAGAAVEYIYRANSCYDANYSGAGYQPYGFVTWMGLFQRCYVISSKITVTFLSYQTSSTTGTNKCGIYLSNVTAARTDPRQIEECEPERSKEVWMPNNGAGSPYRTCSKTFSVKKFMKVKKGAIIADDSLFCTSTTNAAEAAYYHIWAASFDGSDNGNQMPMKVHISYRCIFTDALNKTGSD